MFQFKNFLILTRSAIREINQKYSKPRIKMTPWVNFALISLRVYLIALIAIMIYKFITLLN
jgi:hypothetical protein